MRWIDAGHRLLTRLVKRTVQRRTLARYLFRPGPHCLQIGGGGNILPGWLNTDGSPPRGVMYLDATQMDGLPTGSFDAAFCEHMIEHLPLESALDMIAETYRVLKPGGRIRVVTPSLTRFCRTVLDPVAAGDYLKWFQDFSGRRNADAVDAINMVFYGHGHCFIWSEERLCGELVKAGFVAPTVFEAESYGDALFDRVDCHGKVIGNSAANRFESFAVEARKPEA